MPLRSFYFANVGFLFPPTWPNPPDSSISKEKLPIRPNRKERGRICRNATSFAFSAKVGFFCLNGRSCRTKQNLGESAKMPLSSLFSQTLLSFSASWANSSGWTNRVNPPNYQSVRFFRKPFFLLPDLPSPNLPKWCPFRFFRKNYFFLAWMV